MRLPRFRPMARMARPALLSCLLLPLAFAGRAAAQMPAVMCSGSPDSQETFTAAKQREFSRRIGSELGHVNYVMQYDCWRNLFTGTFNMAIKVRYRPSAVRFWEPQRCAEIEAWTARGTSLIEFRIVSRNSAACG